MISIETGAITTLISASTAIAQGLLPVIAVVLGVPIAFYVSKNIITIAKMVKGG